MTDEAMSPLRRRMIEDMTIRKFASKTQHDYLQRVENFAAFLGRLSCCRFGGHHPKLTTPVFRTPSG